jgi:hypothetical protein
MRCSQAVESVLVSAAPPENDDIEVKIAPGTSDRHERKSPGVTGGSRLEVDISLLQCARCARKYVVCIAPDQANSADHKDEDYRQHHGILGNVLSRVF